MGGIVASIKVWWQTADRSQRMMSVFGSLFMIILLASVYTFASKPSMGLLASGLSPAEQGTVVSELQKQNVPYTMDLQGNVSVPSDKVAELRAKLMMNSKLPNGLGGGDEELSKLGMMNTPRVERERIKAILERRLASTIEFIDGVESARVQITLGEDSPFIADKRPATASVTVSEKGGYGLSREQARGVANMVSKSVPNLDLKDITILNRRGETLFDAGDTGSNGLIGAKLEAEKAESKRRERELQSKLDLAFGPGSMVATVNVELDFDKKSYTETTNTPGSKMVTEENKESMGGPGAAKVGGAAGATSNTVAAPAAVSPDANGSGKYENTQKKYEYSNNVRNTTFEGSSGEMKYMAISVLVNESKKDVAPQVDEFVKAYLGPKAADTSRFSYKVTTAAFDDTAKKEAEKASKAAAGQASQQQIFSLLPVGALFIVGFLVLKGIGKLGKGGTTLMLAGADGQVLSLPSSGISVSGSTAKSLGVRPEFIEEEVEEEEADPEDPTVVRKVKKKKRRPVTDDDDDLEIDSIRKKVNIPLEQIKKMATDRPEIVAMLLKSWLLDERR